VRTYTRPSYTFPDEIIDEMAAITAAANALEPAVEELCQRIYRADHAFIDAEQRLAFGVLDDDAFEFLGRVTGNDAMHQAVARLERHFQALEALHVAIVDGPDPEWKKQVYRDQGWTVVEEGTGRTSYVGPAGQRDEAVS
jgi:hypothetical protein